MACQCISNRLSEFTIKVVVVGVEEGQVEEEEQEGLVEEEGQEGLVEEEEQDGLVEEEEQEGLVEEEGLEGLGAFLQSIKATQ